MGKKLIGLLVVLMVLCSTCSAEGLDYAAMSSEQLHVVIDAARNELAKRELTLAENTVLFEQDGVTVYLTSGFKADAIATDTMHFMRAGVVVVNDSERNINVAIDSMAVNGWDVNSVGFSKIAAGKKQKDELTFNAADTDITTVEEIETVEITFRLSDADTYMFFADVAPITLHYNGQ